MSQNIQEAYANLAILPYSSDLYTRRDEVTFVDVVGTAPSGLSATEIS